MMSKSRRRLVDSQKDPCDVSTSSSGKRVSLTGSGTFPAKLLPSRRRMNNFGKETIDLLWSIDYM
jgi:hypothetical protein